MSTTEQRLLAAMASRADQPVTATEIAALIPVGSAAAINVQFRKLAKRGLVRRGDVKRGPNGGRPATGWHLTAAGLDQAAAFAEIPEPATQHVIRELKTLREQQRITPTRASRQAGLGPNTLRQWESGARSPRLDELARYAGSLGYQITITPAVLHPSQETQ